MKTINKKINIINLTPNNGPVNVPFRILDTHKTDIVNVKLSLLFALILLIVILSVGGVVFADKPLPINDTVCDTNKCFARIERLKICREEVRENEIIECATEMTLNSAKDTIYNELESLYKLSTSPTNVIDEATKFIISFEGYHERAYWDYNHYSIGYGTNAKGRTSITEEQARKEVRDIVKNLLNYKGMNTLSPNKQIAIVSFYYNLGSGRKGYILSETLKGNEKYVANQMRLYVHAGDKKLPGLVKRRNAEANLFLKKN